MVAENWDTRVIPKDDALLKGQAVLYHGNIARRGGRTHIEAKHQARAALLIGVGIHNGYVEYYRLHFTDECKFWAAPWEATPRRRNGLTREHRTQPKGEG